MKEVVNAVFKINVLVLNAMFIIKKEAGGNGVFSEAMHIVLLIGLII